MTRYKGVIVYMRLLDGTIRPGMKVKMMATGAEFQGARGAAIMRADRSDPAAGAVLRAR